MRKGRPFHRSLFDGLAPSRSATRALSKLVDSGSLERVAHGIYMRPKVSRVIGKIPVSPLQIVMLEAKIRGQQIQVHGAEAVRRLGFSTQMQMIPIYFTSGSRREVRIGKAVVQLRHASGARLQGAGSGVGMVLTAIHYLGRQEATTDVVAQIMKRLSVREIEVLQTFDIPKWMRRVIASALR